MQQGPSDEPWLGLGFVHSSVQPGFFSKLVSMLVVEWVTPIYMTLPLRIEATRLWLVSDPKHGWCDGPRKMQRLRYQASGGVHAHNYLWPAVAARIRRGSCLRVCWARLFPGGSYCWPFSYRTASRHLGLYINSVCRPLHTIDLGVVHRNDPPMHRVQKAKMVISVHRRVRPIAIA